MKKTIVSTLLAALLTGFLALPGAVAQEQTIYKWVDEEGVVHYTARPPEGIDYEEVGIETREPVESATAGGEMADSGETAPAEGIPPAQPEMAAAEPDPEMVAERCAQARRNIENLTQRANVLIRGDDGEQRQISDEERQRMLQEARDFIDEWC
ncbi:MAG: DUF4124 domain-containing protein [Wenzhouxiangella sp.]|jgi:hypothetical protein|nr:DUF4124 domain-containing protein [Wenzhouxiangella sp.]